MSKAKHPSVKKVQAELSIARKEIDELKNKLSMKDQVIASVVEDYVPKDSLRKEKLYERLRWWFKDIDKTSRILIHAGTLCITGLLSLGVYFGLLESTKALDIAEGLKNSAPAITAGLAALLGAVSQILSFREPKKKNK